MKASVITAKDVKEALESFADESQARILSRFFKTGKGEYGEGDLFLGIKVPQTRLVVKESLDLSLDGVQTLIDDPFHEVRLCGFLILVGKYAKARKDPSLQKQIVDFYLSNTHKANNWDLVDLSAPKILGLWLRDKERSILYEYARSSNLWQQRVAIVTTWTIIRENDFADTLELSKILMWHPHDLIRKAVGWMLREVGKKDEQLLCSFLDENAKNLSRTSLRYAIERLPQELKTYYMKL